MKHVVQTLDLQKHLSLMVESDSHGLTVVDCLTFEFEHRTTKQFFPLILMTREQADQIPSLALLPTEKQSSQTEHACIVPIFAKPSAIASLILPDANLQKGEAVLDHCCGKEAICDCKNCCGGGKCCMCLSVCLLSMCGLLSIPATQIWSYSGKMSHRVCFITGMCFFVFTVVYVALTLIEDTMLVAQGLVAFLSVFTCMIVFLARIETKENAKFEHKGNYCFDCLAACFCTSCSICQLFSFHHIADKYRWPWQYFDPESYR